MQSVTAGAGGPAGLEHPRWLHHHMSRASVLLLWPLSPCVTSFSRSLLSSKISRLSAWWLPSKNTKERLLGLTASAQHWHCILLSKLSPESVWQRTAPGHQCQAAQSVGWGCTNERVGHNHPRVSGELGASPCLAVSALCAFNSPGTAGVGHVVGQVAVGQDAYSRTVLLKVIWTLLRSWRCGLSLEHLLCVKPLTFLISLLFSNPI